MLCRCEQHPCQFTVSHPSVNLVSVVSKLAPGATVSLVAGVYAGDDSCGWSVVSVFGSGDRAITVRGAAQGASVIDCKHIGPVVAGVVSGTRLRFENLHFKNAHISGSGGAVVRAAQGSHVEIENCMVTTAAGDGEGGAVVISNSSLIVRGSYFEENSALGSGGSLAILNGGHATLLDSTFTSCHSSQNGGALRVAGKSTLVLERMRFVLNSAAAFGGAIHVSRSVVTGCTIDFLNNTAYVAGALLADDGSVLRLTSNDPDLPIRIVGNSAVWFGAVCVMCGTDPSRACTRSKLVLSGEDGNILVQDNHADGWGAISVAFDSHGIIRGNVDISRNSAQFSGGLSTSAGSLTEIYDGVRLCCRP